MRTHQPHQPDPFYPDWQPPAPPAPRPFVDPFWPRYADDRARPLSSTCYVRGCTSWPSVYGQHVRFGSVRACTAHGPACWPDSFAVLGGAPVDLAILLADLLTPASGPGGALVPAGPLPISRPPAGQLVDIPF